jgi:hypothetical protein
LKVTYKCDAHTSFGAWPAAAALLAIFGLSPAWADEVRLGVAPTCQPSDVQLVGCASCAAAESNSTDGGCCCDCCCGPCCPEPWEVAREPLWSCSHLDCLTELGATIDNGCCFKAPVTGGAWH